MRIDSSTPQPQALVDDRHIAKRESVEHNGEIENAGRLSMSGVGGYEILLGGLLMLSWVALFTAGMIIGTDVYRTHLGQPQLLSWKHLIGDSFIVLTCFTYTNLVLLCCLAGMVGQLGFRAHLFGSERCLPTGDCRSHYAAAMIRGFVVYLVLVSGEVLLRSDSFANPNQVDYVKVATAATLLSLLVGYDPRRLLALLRHGTDLTATGVVPGGRESGRAHTPDHAMPPSAEDIQLHAH